jgi:hypothetical protein
MRLAILAVLVFSGLALSADFVQPNATEISELLAGLAKLPTCAVCTTSSMTY